MSDPVRHKSESTLHWNGLHAQVDAARQLPGWNAFHEQCGKHRLFFDSVEPLGKGKSPSFKAICVRYSGKHGHTIPYKAGEAVGDTPVEATAAAFQNAIEGGFDIEPDIVKLLDLTEAPKPGQPLFERMYTLLNGEAPPKADLDLDAMLGNDEPADEYMELLG